MPKSDLRIDILGTDISISAEEEKEYLDKLLSKYRKTIEDVQEKTGLKDPLKIAVLTGFLLCDDLEKAGAAPKKAAEDFDIEEQGEVERLTLSMISRLDELPLKVPDISMSGTLQSILKLQNTVKHYEWGSAEWIPALLGQKNISRIPWAELWMGINPASPSRVIENDLAGDAPATLLSEVINRDPRAFLGAEIVERFGTLPFLFKVLAAAKPLSIQAHPNSEQAREGFDRENQLGIPFDAPNRNYRNPNHKPEIICALGPFEALCGFRETTEILFLMEILSLESEEISREDLERLIFTLKQGDNPIKAFLSVLFNMEAEIIKAIGELIKEKQEQLENDFPEYKDEWKISSYFASLYPCDHGLLAPLYLNIVELQQGEAIYLPAGVFHAYIQGMGIELMADSDNVLRGGLTKKHIDQEELFRVLNFSAYKPQIIKVPNPSPSWFIYPTPFGDFTLSVIQRSPQTQSVIPYHETGPSIVIITEGNASVTRIGDDFGRSFSKGESFFIPAGINLEFNGTFTAYAASCKST